MSDESLPQRARPRTSKPERTQVEMQLLSLDQMLPQDHRARVVWAYVNALDLSAAYEKIQAVEGGAGRDAVDPKILMCLWMMATLEGISSARRLAELTQRDIPYMWICGGVGVNHHLLSDFRTQHVEMLDRILTNSIATLIHENLVTLDRVGQDGMRVRANAGSSSFRRRKTLRQCQQEARDQVKRLKDEQDRDPGADDRRKVAASKRAAEDRQRRLDRALQELEKLSEQKEKREKGSGEEARCSTTDPEARKMKMADGGYRPAYNTQFVTDGDSRLIVAVEVNNQGSDRGQMTPMYADLQRRYGRKPKEYLVDCGFATKEEITEVEREGTEVYAPVYAAEQMLEKGNNPYAGQRGDSPEMVRFRARMGTAEGKAIYAQRSSIAEFPNAGCRNRGLYQFRLRGTIKVKAEALWQALAFNLMRMRHLEYLAPPSRG